MDLVNLIGGVILLFISFCMYIIELGKNKSVKKNNIKNINIKTGGLITKYIGEKIIHKNYSFNFTFNF